jgi:hypothetical protein
VSDVARGLLAAAAAGPAVPSWLPVAVAGVSSLIALGSLAVALSSRAVAGRSLRLSEQQEKRRAAALDVSLKQGLSWRPGDGMRRILLDLLAVNPTDRDGTIVTADLHVSYKPPSGGLLVVKVSHGGTAAWPAGVAPLALPAAVAANGALAGWLVFRLSPGLVPDGSIHGFDAVLHDSRGLTRTVHAWGLTELT